MPLPIVFEFGDPDAPELGDPVAPELGDLARERLIDVLRDQDWDQLGRLRCLGRFRDEALAELQGDDENFGLGFDVDWRGLTARLAAADKAAKADLASSGDARRITSLVAKPRSTQQRNFETPRLSSDRGPKTR